MDLKTTTDKSNYSVRRALIEDAPALSVLIKSSMLNYCEDSKISSEILESTHESLDAIKNRIKYNDCLCLCDSSGKIQGTVTLSLTSNPLKYSFSKKSERFLANYDKCIYISRFAVDSSLRGTGLGLMLLNQADDIANATGHNLFLLHTALTNSERCEYYRNRGFEVLDFESSRGYPRGLFYKILS